MVGAATDLGNRVRSALGDRSSDSARRFATEALSATSVDVVRAYALAMQALSNSQFAEARASFARAVAIDPNFGLAYAGMAIASSNMGQPAEAEQYVKEAIRHVDRMTERERFRTRGLLYFVTNDYEACVKEYGDLLAQYEADVAARNNLALCSTKLRDMTRARDEMKRVVEILPRRSLYRVNVSLYSTYAGNFDAGEEEAAIAQELNDPYAPQALALAKLGQGDFGAAAAAFEALGRSRAPGRRTPPRAWPTSRCIRGASAPPRGCWPMARPPISQARIPTAPRSSWCRWPTPSCHAAGRARPSPPPIGRASPQRSIPVRFMAGRIYAEGGALRRPRPSPANWWASCRSSRRPTARSARAWSLLKRDARGAVRQLTEANKLLDTWIGHFDLGRAYLAAGAFPQADSEFDRCLKRSGEALSLFLDEEPTSGVLPPVYYYLGRAREGMGTAAYADAYRRYLAIRNQTDGDPLAADIRKR